MDDDELEREAEAVKARVIGPLVDAAYALGYPIKPIRVRYDEARAVMIVEPAE